MNKKIALETITPFVESIYKQIGQTPQMFVGDITSIESVYPAGIEVIVGFLTDQESGNQY